MNEWQGAVSGGSQGDSGRAMERRRSHRRSELSSCIPSTPVRAARTCCSPVHWIRRGTPPRGHRGAGRRIARPAAGIRPRCASWRRWLDEAGRRARCHDAAAGAELCRSAESRCTRAARRTAARREASRRIRCANSACCSRCASTIRPPALLRRRARAVRAGRSRGEPPQRARCARRRPALQAAQEFLLNLSRSEPINE